MRNILLLVMFWAVFFAAACNERSFSIEEKDFGTLSIVIPDTAGSISLFAASELKKHLDLIFKADIKIVTSSDASNLTKGFFVGIAPEGFSRKLKREEAVYKIEGRRIYLFGEDAVNRKYSDQQPGELHDKTLDEALNLASSRTGTLSAVYNFLETEFGVRWLKPGDDGIFYEERQTISLPEKEVSWVPALIQRNIRAGMFTREDQELYGRYAPKEFHLTDAEVIRKEADVLAWMRRMRMGRSENYRFGHAYTSYWEKYRDTDPLIFALNGSGERKPVGRIERVKMCASNKDLPGIIVREWQENVKKDPFQYGMSISGCENDSDGWGDAEWCHCDSCMALDDRKPGEKLTEYATDRYVHLWNSILREAKKYEPAIRVTGYAYENMLQPPRKEKLDDGILIEFIPRMGGNFTVTSQLYDGWRKAGMKMMMYRPNDMNWEIGIPFGQEERLFSNYKLALKNNAVGTDFDSMLGFWDGISDMTYYILSKGHADTTASFETLENEYLNCFGEAKDDIARYYRHWRNIFNTKVIPEELRLNNGIDTWFLEWHRLYRLTARLNDFYSAEDFDITDKYLKDASEKSISEQARKYIHRMQLSNVHSRLTFNAFIAGRSGDRQKMKEMAKSLIDFRIQNKDSLDINWNVLFQYQYYHMDDQIGTKYLGFLPEDLSPDSF